MLDDVPKCHLWLCVLHPFLFFACKPFCSCCSYCRAVCRGVFYIQWYIYRYTFQERFLVVDWNATSFFLQAFVKKGISESISQVINFKFQSINWIFKAAINKGSLNENVVFFLLLPVYRTRTRVVLLKVILFVKIFNNSRFACCNNCSKFKKQSYIIVNKKRVKVFIEL